jgi:hypothetical protein
VKSFDSELGELTLFGPRRRVSPPVLGATCADHGRGACAAGGDAPPGATRWQIPRQLTWVLTVILLVSSLTSATHTQQAPWFGAWQQVPPDKKWFDPWPYQQVTLRIEPQDDGLRVVYDMVRRRGGITHMEWSGRFDGRDYPVQGVDYVLTNAYRKLSDRSYEIVVRVDGREAAVATAVVSSDGGTLIVDTTEQVADGRKVTTTANYRRR